MAVQSPDSVITYVGNGSTETAYPISFQFLLADDVKVHLLAPDAEDPAPLHEGTDYTLHIVYDDNNVIESGFITTAEAYDVQHKLFIYRDVPLTQLTQLPEFGPFPANTLEMSLDKMVMALQQLDRAQRRCFRTSSFGPELTPAYPVPNTLLGISTGNKLKMYNWSELRSLIELPASALEAPTAYWLDNEGRAGKVPYYIGQIGLQTNDSSLWRSTGTAAGNWALLALDEDLMTSNHDRRPPTQQSVKAYVDLAKVDATTHANNAAIAAQAAAINSANGYTNAQVGSIPAPTLTIARFTPRDHQAPAANWARLSTRNSISTLRVSDSGSESVCFIGIVPEGVNLSSGVTARWLWSGASATSGSTRWGAWVNRLNGDIDTISEVQLGAVTTATSGTSGVLAISAITYNNNVGLQPGEAFQLRIMRDGGHADDNMSGDAEVIAVELRRVP